MSADRGSMLSLSYDWDKVVRQAPDDRSKKKEYMPIKSESLSTLSSKAFTGKFCTDSVYTGQHYDNGINGSGTYTLPYGVVYTGEFRDGMYHHEGRLTYPMGQTFRGKWFRGRLTGYKFSFPDSLKYDEDWKYCEMPDRRFFTCIQDGLRPAGRSLLTNDECPRRIPDGCYDTGDGYYNPKTKCVMSAIKPGRILRIPTKSEETWIMENCRKAWDEPTGYNKNLYEKWVSGRKGECEERGSIEAQFSEYNIVS